MRKLEGIDAQLAFLLGSLSGPVGSYYIDRILDLKTEKAQLEFDLKVRPK